MKHNFFLLFHAKSLNKYQAEVGSPFSLPPPPHSRYRARKSFMSGLIMSFSCTNYKFMLSPFFLLSLNPYLIRTRSVFYCTEKDNKKLFFSHLFFFLKLLIKTIHGREVVQCFRNYRLALAANTSLKASMIKELIKYQRWGRRAEHGATVFLLEAKWTKANIITLRIGNGNEK